MSNTKRSKNFRMKSAKDHRARDLKLRKKRKRKRKDLRSNKSRDKKITELYGKFGHRSCGRKTRFRNRGDAEKCAGRYPQHNLIPYKCELCGGWHLTSHPFDAQEIVNGADLSVRDVLEQAREAALEIRRAEEELQVQMESIGPQGYSMGVHAKHGILDPMRKVDAMIDYAETSIDYELLNQTVDEGVAVVAGIAKVSDPLTVEVVTRYYLQAESWSDIVKGNPANGTKPLAERHESLSGMSNTRLTKLLKLSVNEMIDRWESIGIAHLKEMGMH